MWQAVKNINQWQSFIFILTVKLKHQSLINKKKNTCANSLDEILENNLKTEVMVNGLEPGLTPKLQLSVHLYN